MKIAALLVVALAIAFHGVLNWSAQRYTFEMIDETSVVRMDTMTGDFAICSVRGAFLSADRTVVCPSEGGGDDE